MSEPLNAYYADHEGPLFIEVYVMEEKARLIINNKKIKKPFKTYDVSGYSELYVDGAYFPLAIESKLRDKIQVKEQRDLKPLVNITEMWKNFEKEDITLGKTDEEREQIKNDLESLLVHINYYRLSVYRLFLKEEQRDFDHLYQLYSFDTELRALIARMLPTIENSLKATLAYSLAYHYKERKTSKSLTEALCYLDGEEVYKREYNQNGKVKMMLSGFADLLNSKQDKDPMIRHHLEMYGGNIPIWMLVEFLTLGDVYTISIYLERRYRKKWAKQLFGDRDVKDGWLVEWIKTIQLLRNSCAHNARLYGSKPTYNPAIIDGERQKVIECLEKERSYRDIPQYVDNELKHTIFAGILTMKVFYQANPNEKIRWNEFVDELEELISKSSIMLEYLGFVGDWKAILTIL